MEQLNETDIKLIYYVMKRFTNYRNKEDLFQVGWIGLNKAYQNYNPSYSAKFTTYAYFYIFGEMSKLVNEDRSIKISRDITKLRLKIEKASILLSQQLMRQPTNIEIATFLEIDPILVDEAINSVNTVLDIDEVMVGNREDNLIDDNLYLDSALNHLSKDELIIIKNRYMNDLTQREIANMLGMNQVQVSRTEKKVLQKLRKELVV